MRSGRLAKLLRRLRGQIETARPPSVAEPRGPVIFAVEPEREWWFDVKWGELGIDHRPGHHITVWRRAES